MSNSSNEQNYQLPPSGVFQPVSKIAILEDKPIMLDYWVDSLNPTSSIIIGVRENGEKLLVKSSEEYTSPIGKIYKLEDCYICVTENSIYVVSATIKTKRVS
jgi:hypothetical protein